MAQLIINIPDIHLPRLILALTPLLKEGEAIDIESPTGPEARLKAENICKEHLIEIWKAQEWKANNDSFIFEDTGIE